MAGQSVVEQQSPWFRLRSVMILVVFCVLNTAAWGQVQGEPRIEFVGFSIEPMALKPGDSFLVRATAKTTGVPLGSFVLRTADGVARKDTIPGLSLYSKGNYYLAEGNTLFIKDNGGLDEDSRKGSCALRISTEGWKEGVYRFALFASRRPSKGPFVAARRDFSVTVRNARVLVKDLGEVDIKTRSPIPDFQFRPATVTPGTPVVVTVKTGAGGGGGIHITHPYPIARSDVLPGFTYHPAEKKAFFGGSPTRLLRENGPSDRDPAPDSIEVALPTDDWRAGVHHFVAELVNASGKVVDSRSFAVKIPGRGDQLTVDVGEPEFFGSGRWIDRFIKLRDGTLLYSNPTLQRKSDNSRRSQDGGRTWNAVEGGIGVGGLQLTDRSIIGFEYKCGLELDEPGWYPLTRSISTDGGRSFKKDQARVFVPEAKAAKGHGSYPGPIFMRSIVQRRDGTLLALMAGWFKSDKAICPYGKGRPYSRSYVCESDDGGRTWRYVSTIGYAHLGSEGYNEGDMRRLPNGELLAVLRTGNEKDIKCQDNPIMWSVSKDEGRTWSKPARTGVEGAFPNLAVLSDGLVVMGYGRPGAMLVFSADGGRTWTDHTLVDVTPYSGYTGIAEIGPGELLVGFGTKNYLDPKTLARSDGLRLARVRYETKPARPATEDLFPRIPWGREKPCLNLRCWFWQSPTQ